MILTISKDDFEVTEYTSKYPCIPIECLEFRILYSSYSVNTLFASGWDQTCPAVSIISVVYSWPLYFIVLEKVFSMVG